MTHDHKVSNVSIGSFEIQDITQGRNAVPPVRPPSQKAIPAHQDASVSSWHLPTIEKKEDHQKEDIKAKLARLEKEAYEKGFEQGQKDGLSLEQKKIEEMGKEFVALCSSISDLKAVIYSESEKELLKLCLAITKKIIHTEVQTNKEIIQNTVRSALKYVADKRRIRIIINPDDMEDVKRLLPDLSKFAKGGQFQLTEDHAVERGGCIIETGFGRINASIDQQFNVIEEEIERLFRESRGGVYNESLS
ncbi:MAG: hypothetical protein JW932_03960 [Deltaproteobacteria bacterium]|nr:hypothetical protein [Deltaproteobacteria bacterium]